MIVGLLHASINFFSWIMPSWFKTWLNRGYKGLPAAIPEGLPEKMPELVQKALSSSETMVIIDFIGGLLAAKIDKSPGAVKGMLLVAVQEWQETSGKLAINFLEFKEVISTTLQRRLASISVPDADKVVSDTPHAKGEGARYRPLACQTSTSLSLDKLGLDVQV